MTLDDVRSSASRATRENAPLVGIPRVRTQNDPRLDAFYSISIRSSLARATYFYLRITTQVWTHTMDIGESKHVHARTRAGTRL